MVAYIADATVNGKKTTVSEVNKSKPLVDVFADGEVRVQDLAGKSAHVITVTHPLVDDTIATTLGSFHTTNKQATIQISPSDGFDYDAYFQQGYDVVEIKGTFQTLRTRLIGNRV